LDKTLERPRALPTSTARTAKMAIRTMPIPRISASSRFTSSRAAPRRFALAALSLGDPRQSEPRRPSSRDGQICLLEPDRTCQSMPRTQNAIGSHPSQPKMSLWLSPKAPCPGRYICPGPRLTSALRQVRIAHQSSLPALGRCVAAGDPTRSGTPARCSRARRVRS